MRRSQVSLLQLIADFSWSCAWWQLDARWTPLHYAVMGGHDKIAETLIEKAPVRRITINRKDKHGMTPLMLVRLALKPPALDRGFHPHLALFTTGLWRGPRCSHKGATEKEGIHRRNRRNGYCILNAPQQHAGH
jgi:hypothetical protein